jgi:carboxyl-terminal processing protease
MPKRNLAWMLVIVLIALLFWQLPSTVARRDTVYRTFEPLVDIRAEILKNYVEEVDEKDLIRGAIEGMLQKLDPYSNYFGPEQMTDLQRDTTGSFGGIGVLIDVKDGWLTVISPIEESPAFRAGVLAGDRLLEVEGESTKGMTMSDAVNKLTGKPGTKVSITVRHELKNEQVTLSLTRDNIKIISVKGWQRRNGADWDCMIDRQQKIGYIRVSKFMPDTARSIDEAVKRLQAEGLKALILDLRLNPGGLLESAIEVADLFLDEGVIVSTKGRWSQKKDSMAKKEGTYPNFPMAVLVNRYTASAAEIVAGALRDHKRAVVIGERTFGKGSVQNVIRLEDNQGAIKLTTAYYYLPKGECIHKTKQAEATGKWGVEPLIEVKLSEDELLAVINSRREADIIRPDSQPTTVTTTRPSSGLIVDRQIDQALKILKVELNEPRTAQAPRKAG